MTIKRTNVGDIELSVAIYRDGERLESSSGEWDLKEFVRTFEIYESLSSATIEATVVIEDSAGLIGALTGSELFEIQIKGTVVDKKLYLRSYNIHSRSRTNQNNDIYIVNMASDEYIRNEVTNVFGNSEKIFSDTESSQIVRELLRGNQQRGYLKSGKRVFLEETINSHTFIIPNWRVFDTIYWLSQRSVRKSESGGTLQNGFAFFENSLGYHFKSIDKLIDDVNAQTQDPTNFKTGKPRLYSYSYSPKKVDSGTMDQFRIDTVTFPQEKNFLMGLRHGTWSGFSIGFDPNTISSSKMGVSTDMSVDAYRYSIKDEWKKMSHLSGSSNKNTITDMDESIQQLIDYPKRVRYTVLPNQIFDPKFQDNPQKNYEQLVELQAYQWMRIESLKTVKLQIQIPGNLDLYVGSGIDVVIPGTFKAGNKTNVDKRYSGRYLIVGLTHKGTPVNMKTELLLMKDSTI